MVERAVIAAALHLGRATGKRLCSLVLLFALAVLSAGARADERILDFHSRIIVAADATITVEETLRVRTDNETIKHVIRRDIPVLHFDRDNNGYAYYITPLSASLDGRVTSFSAGYSGDSVHITIGNPSATLEPGEHTFMLRYLADDELDFLDTHDKLDWNVTGARWSFPIDHAAADITLPGNVDPAQMHLTGLAGSRSDAIRSAADAPSHATVETTQQLALHDGLSFSLDFPKGVVPLPESGHAARHAHALRIGLYALAMSLVFYLVAWWRVRRKLPAAVPRPLYEVPKDYSPGALRFVDRNGYDDRCFGVDVLDLAARGAVKIDKVHGRYSIDATRPGSEVSAPAPEQQVYDTLLRERGAPVVLDGTDSGAIGPVRAQHERRLVGDYGKLFYNTHRGLSAIGMAFGALAMMAMVLASPVRTFRLPIELPVITTDRLAPMAAIALGAVALVCLWRCLEGLAKDRRATRGKRKPSAVAAARTFGRVLGSLLCVFVYTLMFGLWLRPWGFVIAFAMLALNAAFFFLLPGPSPSVQRMRDQIAGLRLYLGGAGASAAATQTQTPPMTAGEFQRFLPYALALETEGNWTERFVTAVGAERAANAIATTMSFYAVGVKSASFRFFNDELIRAYDDWIDSGGSRLLGDLPRS